ncbi:MAG: leuB, partial [Acidobacteria bacterium]|nr:leuB [Acidobacteriota bacterium]
MSEFGMELNILLLPGDGIGPEVIQEAVRVLGRVASTFGHSLRLREALIGG